MVKWKQLSVFQPQFQSKVLFLGRCLNLYLKNVPLVSAHGDRYLVWFCIAITYVANLFRLIMETFSVVIYKWCTPKIIFHWLVIKFGFTCCCFCCYIYCPK